MATVEHPIEFYFQRKNYFTRFLSNESSTEISKALRHAVEYFVEDLRRDRIQTIERVLNETSIEQIFQTIGQLLTCADDRICSDSAYILGSAVETERGLERFLLAFSKSSVDIIEIFCQLLTHHDSECVLNAAGTLGTICGSKEGRDLIVHHVCIAQMLINTALLLASTNVWIVSNAALVLARLTVEELGCERILTHPKHSEILNRLLTALDIEDIQRSTNIAFAIARLIEGENGKKVLINDCGQEKFFNTLLTMLEVKEEKDIHKNACYTLSSFCTNQFGFELCIRSMTIFRRILIAIERILLSSEHETVWFALMCLRTIAKYEGASEHFYLAEDLLKNIRNIRTKWPESKQIQTEAKLLWFLIHRDSKPPPPTLVECEMTSAEVMWNPCQYNWDDIQVEYRIFLNETPIAVTNGTTHSFTDLKSNTTYQVRIQYITNQGESVPSEPLVFHTNDQSPPEIVNLHAARTTMTAIRIVWEISEPNHCQNLKGFQVYLNNTEYEMTSECGTTIHSLAASTEYQIDVCSVTSRGHGTRSSIRVKTSSAGDSLPPPPTFSVIGRRELHIKWQAPELIAGRLTRYDLFCNDRCIYSGTDQEYRATMLKCDTEYIAEVVAITNEGRFRSRPAKTRTLKDEFQNSHRHSLYEPSSQHSPRMKRADTVQMKKTLSNLERSPVKETFLPNQNIQITTVRAVQFKAENASPRRALPGLVKSSPIRSIRTSHRPRLDVTSINQQRITASVIIPTLDIDHSRDMHWSSRMKSFRYPL